MSGGPIAWLARRQQTTALSSAEAEYMTMTEGVKMIKYLVNVGTFIGTVTHQQLMMPIFTDSQSAMHMAVNPVSSQRTRHINVRYHFIREAILSREVILKFVPSKEQLADILTKALPLPAFRQLVLAIYGM